MKRTLANYYLVTTLLVSVVIITILISFFHNAQNMLLKESTQSIKKNIIENYKKELVHRIEGIEQNINHKKLNSEQRLRNSISSRVEEAHKIAASLYVKYKDKKSIVEIKELIKNALREIRFNNGRGYYFIDDLKGNCVLFPMRPDLEGKNILQLQDLNGKHIIKDFLNIVQTQNEGFSFYYAQKKKYTTEGNEYKKIAFVKLFEPLQWIIGTGEFVDDVESDIKQELMREIASYRTGDNSGYINVYEVHDFNGGEAFATMIINDNRLDIVGQKISSNITDMDGKKYRQEALDIVNKNGSGFLTYKYKKLNSDEITDKLAYVKKLDHWNWVISSGIYLDKLNQIIEKNDLRAQEISSHSKDVMIAFCIIVFVFLLCLTVFISSKVKSELKKVYAFFKHAAIEEERIDATKFLIDDFKGLALFANTMLENLHLKQRQLEEANNQLETRVNEKTKELSLANAFLEEKNKLQEINLVTDTLTGLGNRNKLAQDLEEGITPTLMIIDIDGFKNINDFYGTQTGDLLLVEIAAFIKNFPFIYPTFVYRLSSDEFLVMIDESADQEKLRACVENFIKEVSIHKFFDHTESITFSVDVTCGIASGREKVLGKADIALNYAKKRKLSFAFFDAHNPHMDTQRHNIYWREKIQWAINNDLVVPYFQPIINIDDPTVSKYETLMRIQDGNEIIGPYAFLGIAKETKQYASLTKMMIAKTFETFAKTKSSFSINISLLDVEDAETVEFLIENLERYNIGKQLILEILETEEILLSEIFLEFVRTMKTYGVCFALDDFGSGYSNFAFLLKMQPKFLKIDGSLIQNIYNDPNAYKIVKTIVNFAREIDAEVVAEFVENAQIVEVLKTLKIHWMQGYHFGAPSPLLKG